MPKIQNPKSKISLTPLTQSKPDVKRFMAVPHGIYREDPLWVAPIEADLGKALSTVNPFFEHARMQMWVAEVNGRDVGRITAILDRHHNEIHHEQTAFFGFFESINDPEVSGALFDTAARWALEQGMNCLLGPMNPSTNDECGLLVEGFDSPPVLMMTYNPRYYIDLLEQAGFVKAKDLLAFHFKVSGEPLERLGRLAEAVTRRSPELTVRNIRKKTLRDDLDKVKEVYNAAWEDNWGFVPMTDREIDFMAERLRPLIMEDMLLLAETPAEPVGFMLNLPDYNEAFAPLRGRLLTPRIVRALPYLLGWKSPRFVRIVALGFKKSWRMKGLDAMMFARANAAALRRGFTDTEVSWLLEDNYMVQRATKLFGGRQYKTYRLYEKPIG